MSNYKGHDSNFSRDMFSLLKLNIVPNKESRNRRAKRPFIVLFKFSIQSSFQERVLWKCYLFRCEFMLNLASSLFPHGINTYFFVSLLVYFCLIDWQFWRKEKPLPGIWLCLIFLVWKFLSWSQKELVAD